MHSMESNFFKYENEIYFFVSLSQKYFHIFHENLVYYKDDEPSLYILFIEFADLFLEEFNSLDLNKKNNIFQHIENMLNSNDEYLSEATATGLLETIIIKAENIDNSNNLRNKILMLFYENSFKYIKQWSEFQGINLLIEQITLSQLADILQWCGLKTVEDITQIILSVIISNNQWDEYKKLFENIKQSVSDDELKDIVLPNELVSNILDALGMIVFYRKDSNSISSLSYEPNEHNLRLTNQWSEFIRKNGFNSIKKYNSENETILKTSDALFQYGFKTIDKVYERTLVEL